MTVPYADLELHPAEPEDTACPDCERTHPWRDHGPIEPEDTSGYGSAWERTAKSHPAEPEDTSGAVIVYVALAVVGGLALAGFVWWVVLR